MSLNCTVGTKSIETVNYVEITIKSSFTHNETNKTLKPTYQCDILDCVYFIMTFTNNEPVSLVSMTNRYYIFVSTCIKSY